MPPLPRPPSRRGVAPAPAPAAAPAATDWLRRAELAIAVQWEVPDAASADAIYTDYDDEEHDENIEVNRQPYSVKPKP